VNQAMTRTQAVASATGLFAVWTLATYLLEARPGTFLKPDATSRFLYTVVANVLIGTVGATLVIREVVRRAEFPRATTYGFAKPRRMLVLVPVSALVAGLFLTGQELPTSDPVILANASAQVLVVSIAEVVVCWALFGGVLRNALGPGFMSAGIAVVLAALAFGVYHFAHSPPFNTPAMVLLLSGVGVATGLFFFLGGDLYSTILLHNTFAVRGVIQALAESGSLDRYASSQLPLIGTAIAAVVVLATADVMLIRPLVRGASRVV
jgi:membrane protease YdiL (CAAX protease family)